MAETIEKGTISINTENIFPIIKKFLYSDHEIFLRELVSNAVDATQKLRKLASMGEFNGELGDLKIEVSFNKDKKTITVKDRGIGMTGEEIKKYINQIAFSGATEFIEKFKDKADAKDIIGKFGLGFYSSFMVSDLVVIRSRSYQSTEGARWECDGSTEFELQPETKDDRGSEVLLNINKDSEEFLDEFRLKGILEKYCKFLPVEIKFGTKEESIEDGVDKEGKTKYKSVTKDRIINNPSPLWVKSPNELKDEDYINWKKLPIKPGKTWWGGEPAGELFTNYLKPVVLTLYTLETKNEIIKHYRLIPDPNGNVKVYRKFWKYDDENTITVPQLLIYTDLMNTGDYRCIETAQKIYNDLLKEKF